jgi:hypothetical protein
MSITTKHKRSLFMSTNPYRITDKSHADIMGAFANFEAAQKTLQATINVIARAIGVPDGYEYSFDEKAFNPKKSKPADVQS